MSSDISKKLTVDWPKNMSYDISDQRTADYVSERVGVVTKRGSIFYKKRLLDVFLFAMAKGKQKGLRTPLTKKSNSMPTDALKEEEIWLMSSIALSEKNSDLDILTKPEEIIKICEEYANTGVKDLIAIDFSTSISDPLEPYEKLMEDNLEKLTR